jgi:hypothetical protein
MVILRGKMRDGAVLVFFLPDQLDFRVASMCGSQAFVRKLIPMLYSTVLVSHAHDYSCGSSLGSSG